MGNSPSSPEQTPDRSPESTPVSSSWTRQTKTVPLRYHQEQIREHNEQNQRLRFQIQNLRNMQFQRQQEVDKMLMYGAGAVGVTFLALVGGGALLLRQRNQTIKQIRVTASQLKQEHDALVRSTTSDLENQKKFGVKRLAVELMDVADDLQRAVEHQPVPANEPEPHFVHSEVETFVQGVGMIENRFLSVLSNNDIAKISPTSGGQFDPHIHEACATVPVETDSQTPGTIAEVLQNGYTLHERVLRPARVVVFAK